MTFKKAATKILKDANKALHYRDITKQALDKNLIETAGKTPWATMNAVISGSIKKEGNNSVFLRSEPGHYKHKPRHYKATLSEQLSLTDKTRKRIRKITRIQKGDIAEARVVELLTLYNNKEGLTCYRPVSDDEGIDLIVKKRSKLEVAYIQVKSSYGKRFVSTIKNSLLKSNKKLILVFVYYDLAEGDLLDYVFCIPASEFINLTKVTKDKRRTFTAGIKYPEKSKFARFMIEKRELGNSINELMDNFK